MKIQSLVITTITLVGLTAVPTVRADEVLAWNEIMQATVAAGNANAQGRSGAIVQLAVFEAVNSIVGDYQPYLGTIAAPEWASPEAAAVAAAHGTLVALHPASASTLNTLRAASLALIPDGPAKDAGIAVGQNAALAMLLLRANDGAAGAGNVPYTPGTEPGDWQPAPPAFAPASQPGWGQVVPFGLETGSQFRLPPPPPLDSGRYALDYSEVKLVGRIDAGPDIRPQDRTDVARFFAVTSPVQAWNPAARQVSAAQGRTLSENARIFALLGMAICDASIAAYDTKYHYLEFGPRLDKPTAGLFFCCHVSSDMTRYTYMGFPTKVQLIQRKQSQQWYINFPSALAQAMDFAKGEDVQWTIADKGHLILSRNWVPPNPVALKKTPPSSSNSKS